MFVQERLPHVVGGQKIFAGNPPIGVGTGDPPAGLRRVQPNRRPGFYGGNLHNMHILTIVRLDIPGLASVLYLICSGLPCPRTAVCHAQTGRLGASAAVCGGGLW